MKTKLITAIAAFLTATVLGGFAVTGTASADAPEGGNASCMAYEASDVSPPGSTTGATNQFGMPGVMNVGIQGAVDAGIFDNRGGFVTLLSQAKLGSHEACDAEFGLDPDTE
jgi:hypothetical protein